VTSRDTDHAVMMSVV